ncbi:hypothetical protein PC41400_21650 [Paenibacillus chitinolyticus]|uniref:ArpU family transcriptional regulator n=1 Tax=Paenibacillus chitinolyticus TaxID=79263 RepID=A0A410X0L0_9BACL|nr:hypothetical protein [Paenibacillus chitinolyticus]MCY9593736.1 hypothetical protein [Paenibacillus chitinolyticus]MCY9599698.1 hypothetical protein [Paenibacillus chitinolyticus]QAV20127.1 hypothetical protein PC41400_21650 [Paenibacillus chitinolyticus]
MSVMYMMEELFPKATKADIARAKEDLRKYREDKQKVLLFESEPPETEIQIRRQAALIKSTRRIERAISQITFADVRSVMEYRFLKGNSRAATILYFSGWHCCEKTIDRKITEGILSVADTLLYLD